MTIRWFLNIMFTDYPLKMQIQRFLFYSLICYIIYYKNVAFF
jgi:hypothetical protein